MHCSCDTQHMHMYLFHVSTACVYVSFVCMYSTLWIFLLYIQHMHVSFTCIYSTGTCIIHLYVWYILFQETKPPKRKKKNFKLKLFPLHSITLRRNRNDKYPNIKDLKTTSFNIPPEVETQSSQHFLSSFPKFLFLWVPRIRPSPYPSQHFVSISPLRVCSRPCRRLTFAWSSS